MASSQPTNANPVLIVGGGLAGLVAAHELTKRKVPVIIIDQETPQNLGGQAFWSLGGLFLVNSVQQRRVGIKDSRARAYSDWMRSAQFDREKEDYWPKQWAKAFVDFATDEFATYVGDLGLGFTPNVGWAERGSGDALGHGNSVPRFHLTWGTGPEVVRIFEEPVQRAAKKGLVEFRFRHRVDEVIVDPSTGAAVGVKGKVLEPSDAVRGAETSRVEIGDFELRGAAVLVSSGGIGGNINLVSRNWPVDRLGKAPEHFVVGVPAHVDGRMLDISKAAGASVINTDRMWHYTEGLSNWDPIWPNHGIRIIPGPSSLWLDANGDRLPNPCYPGTDTLSTLKYICSTGHHYSWFILNKSIIAREFALSGSEQNPDVTGKSLWGVLQRIFGGKGTGPVQKFLENGVDFVVRDDLKSLVDGMNELAATIPGPKLDYEKVKETVELRDDQTENKYSKDYQIMLVNNARAYWPDRLARVTKLHKLLDKKFGPLIAVRMNLLTRKSLGGLETDLKANVIREDGSRFPGLYAAGEAAGFGGGGVHGYSALEGTFLGNCIFGGRQAGRAIADLLLEDKEQVQAKL